MAAGDDWPVAVISGKYVPHVAPSSLQPIIKTRLWAHLKANHPEVARDLVSFSKDDNMQKLIDAFDGAVVIERKYLDEVS